MEARSPDELTPALSRIAKDNVDAVMLLPSPMFFDQRELIVGLPAKHRLHAVFNGRDWVDIGGLISYGPDVNDMWRRAATYVDKIFKGAKPADLPIEQPTKFELLINLKTAKALAVTFPPALLARA